MFGSTVIANILKRFPDAVFIGSFVLFVVAFEMLLSEPIVGNYVDPLHDVVEHVLPFVAGAVLTAKQYYRSRIKS